MRSGEGPHRPTGKNLGTSCSVGRAKIFLWGQLTQSGGQEAPLVDPFNISRCDPPPAGFGLCCRVRAPFSPRRGSVQHQSGGKLQGYFQILLLCEFPCGSSRFVQPLGPKAASESADLSANERVHFSLAATVSRGNKHRK